MFTLAVRSVHHKLVSRNLSTAMERGAFIVFEGCDKSGKTTQCNHLVDRLNKSGVTAQLWKFPDRTTLIGKMINDYLQQSCQLEDHVIHLLFAANRWEAMPKMRELLDSGVTLVVDRYSFSGVAFTSAKPGLSMEWCCGPEKGLLSPDHVFYLTVPADVAAQRGDYGSEIYEKKEIQEKVATIFQKLQADDWTVIVADKTVDELSTEIFQHAMNVINTARTAELQKLWLKDCPSDSD